MPSEVGQRLAAGLFVEVLEDFDGDDEVVTAGQGVGDRPDPAVGADVSPDLGDRVLRDVNAEGLHASISEGLH